MMSERPKVAIIGLDGATWNLIMPWAEEGILPTFKRLIEGGTWGKLKSVVPISTAPSWKCYSTGKNPGKLGAYFWYTFDRTQKSIEMVNSTSFKSKELWDYLGEADCKCGIINMPTSFPPKKVNGFMVSGFNALDQLDYTFPKDLKGRLVEQYGYKVNPNHTLRLDFLLNKEKALAERDKGISEIRNMICTRFAAAKDLWKSETLDFLHLTIFYIDNLQHYMWGPMAENDPVYGDVLPECWKMIDAELGEFLQFVGDDCSVFIMSDHGFDQLKARFKFNLWFYQKGYLKLRRKGKFTIASLLYRLGINTQRAYRISRSKIGGAIIKLVPHSIISRMWFLLRTSKDDANIIDILDIVDWKKTKALMIGESIFFINLPKGSREYEEFRTKLMQEMKAIKNPQTGRIDDKRFIL